MAAVSPILTPQDNFPGRSNTRFGVGELINLSFSSVPDSTAADLGGLRWFISEGGGTLTGTAGDDGTAVYTAPSSGGSVTLVIKITTGPDAGVIVATVSVTIVEPFDAVMAQRSGTGIFHQDSTWSCSFIGDAYLRPTDVSFSRVLVREASAAAIATGFLGQLNGLPHDAGSLCAVGAGDSTFGSRLNIPGGDKVDTGVRFPPFSEGDFLWQIPWEFTVDGSPLNSSPSLSIMPQPT